MNLKLSFLLFLSFSCLSLQVSSAKSFFDTITSFFSSSSSTVSNILNLPSFINEENALKSFSKNLQKDLNITVVDYSKDGLPKVRIGHRVADLFNGWHFDDILQDSPNEIRPGNLVAFYDSSDGQCMEKYKEIDLDHLAEKRLPPRSQLFVARYDTYAAPIRAWYEFTPEMDLAKRFDVDTKVECPQILFVSRKCDGFTEWCERGKDPTDPTLNILGCENFIEHCKPSMRKKFDTSVLAGLTLEQKWQAITKFVDEEISKDGKPKISKFLGSFHEQGKWLQKRDYTSSDNHFRNVYLSNAFPAFTQRGFKAVETPKEFQDWLLEFVRDYDSYRRTEYWNAESTQMSFHELPTTFIDMDKVRAKKEQMARKYIQPLLEEWSNLAPLELTSFYGMREYHAGAWLKQHVDRIDTHVISGTFTVAKVNFTKDELAFLYEIMDQSEVEPDKEKWIQNFHYKPWPLQVTDWTGQQIAYDHPPGTLILYESSKLPHGRNSRNQGGVHLGCFVHFKPQEMHAKDAKHWDDITAKARKNKEIHTEHAVYRSTSEVEPSEEEKEMMYSSLNVGDQSVWTDSNGNRRKSAKDADDSGDNGITVEFRNRSERSLQVFWTHESRSKPVLQGSVSSGSSFTVISYPGHQFFWAELDSEEPVGNSARFTIDGGKKVYEYNFRRDGSRNTEVSKWAEAVRQKIEQEKQQIKDFL